jgi:hypothetical protein
MIREAPSDAFQPVAILLHAVDVAGAEGAANSPAISAASGGSVWPTLVGLPGCGCPSDAHRGAGVHQARVSHLVGAPCGTTALAGPHRLMPVLVPAVVPLVPSNKANESSLHGAAFPTEPTLRIQASGVHDEARSRAGRSVGCRHACLPKLLTNRFDLDRYDPRQTLAYAGLRVECETR